MSEAKGKPTAPFHDLESRRDDERRLSHALDGVKRQRQIYEQQLLAQERDETEAVNLLAGASEEALNDRQHQGVVSDEAGFERAEFNLDRARELTRLVRSGYDKVGSQIEQLETALEAVRHSISRLEAEEVKGKGKDGQVVEMKG